MCLPHQGGGCGLMTRTRKFEEIVKGMNYVSVKIIWWKASKVDLNNDFSHALFCFTCTVTMAK